jgi:hypothetical protein
MPSAYKLLSMPLALLALPDPLLSLLLLSQVYLRQQPQRQRAPVLEQPAGGPGKVSIDASLLLPHARLH